MLKNLFQREKKLKSPSAYFPYDETIYIDAKYSGLNSKEYFLDNNGSPCDTEAIVRSYLEAFGFQVLRSEVSLWQAFTVLSFWEEIFDFKPAGGNDLPEKYFSESEMYESRKIEIDKKHIRLLNGDVAEIVTSAICNYRSSGAWTRLIEDQDAVLNICSLVIDEFLKKVNPRDFAFIVFTMIRNPNGMRAGIPDFLAWDDNDIYHVEAKRAKEKIRHTQRTWLELLRGQGIKCKVVRVKGGP